MTRDHEMIEELLAVRALGGLDGDDAAILEQRLTDHGDCEECRGLEDGFAETAGRLGFALEPLPVDAAMADRIIGSAEPPGQPVPRRGEANRRILAAAAAFVALVAGVSVVRGSGPGEVQVSAAQRFVEFTGDAGSLAMAFDPDRPGIVMWGHGLPDPGEGKTYELWSFVGGTPTSQGCMQPTDGRIAAFVDTAIGEAESMALTVEPDSCPAAPTTAPVFTGALS